MFARATACSIGSAFSSFLTTPTVRRRSGAHPLNAGRRFRELAAQRAVGRAARSRLAAARWDHGCAAFDKLRLRADFSAVTGIPQPELVEGRTALDAVFFQNRDV